MPLDRIYLDHAATTPMLPEVAEAMRPWLREEYGNPSSLYAEGRRAKSAIDESRETLAHALGSEFGEIVFTSSGTEACNLAILGTALANEQPTRTRILMGAAEHHCVLHTKPILERLGFRIETLPVDRFARLDREALQEALAPDVLLVCAMHANNELGTIDDAAEIGEMARTVGALTLCDAVQTFLEPQPKVGDLNADLISVSAHKVYGPKGSAALYIRAGTRIRPIAVGGGQEREMRAGTENVAAIVGFAEAVRRVPTLPDQRLLARKAFLASLGSLVVPTVHEEVPTLPGHIHVRFPGVDAETLLIRLDREGISASSGAACSSGSVEPSHVLQACGYSPAECREGLRFTFGRLSAPEEAAEAARRVAQAVLSVRAATKAHAS